MPSARFPSAAELSVSSSRDDVSMPLWAEGLVRLLDRAFVIPGTKIPIGLDAILGFIAPGAGDAASAIATASLLWLAFQLRVPKVIVLRMLLNVAVDGVVGAIPFVGDAFDVFFRAGDRNLALVKKYARNRAAKPDVAGYAILGFALVCVAALLALPIVVGLALVHSVARWSGD